MGTVQSPQGSPFTADERIQIKELAEKLIRSHIQKNHLTEEEAFQETRLALYEDFIATYLARNANFPPDFKYHDIILSLWGRRTTIQVPELEIFKKLRPEWDINALGYLFEFLRGLQARVEGDKVKLEAEKGGSFRSKTGAVFTPYEICQKIAENAFHLFLDTHLGSETIPDVLDPACGGGAFLIAAARVLHSRVLTSTLKDIVLQHLFGIDIDPEAVFIAILSLWGLIGDPNLDLTALTCNIFAGNTLLPKDAPELLHPLAWEKIFPNVLKGGGFDFVIGNPPYVRQEKIRDIKPFLEHYKSYSPTADLYVYFFEKGIDLLKPGGFLSFITSNSFLRTRSARPFRVFLKESIRITDFYDAFQGPVFAAGVTPCILTVQKSAPSGTVRINEDKEISQTSLEDRAWNFLPNSYLQVLGKMDQCHTTLVDHCAVYFCIKPGRVEDFVLTPAQISRLKLEESLFQPVLRGTDVKQYVQPVPKVNILFPYNESAFERMDWQIIAEKFPQIHDYLLNRRESLEARDDYQRNKDHMMWYELRPCNYYPEFRQPKILTPDICHTNSFTLDTRGYFCLDTIFMIRPKETAIPIEFWAGFLNSRPVEFFLKMTSTSLGKRGFRYKKQFLEKIPVPNFEKDTIKQISNLARENISLENALRQPEIDHIICRSFAFSADEIQLADRFLQGLS